MSTAIAAVPPSLNADLVAGLLVGVCASTNGSFEGLVRIRTTSNLVISTSRMAFPGAERAKKIPKDHLDVDTRAAPTGDFEKLTMDGMFVDQPSTIADGVTSSSTGAQSGGLYTEVPYPPSSIATKTLTSLQTSTSSLVHNISYPSSSQSIPQLENKISGGAIFTIIVGSIIGIILPILLLTQYIKRGNRMGKEDKVLEEVLVTGIVNEKAQDIGMKRLQEAWARKWATDDIKFEQGDPVGRRVRVRAKEEYLFLQLLFEPSGVGGT